MTGEQTTTEAETEAMAGSARVRRYLIDPLLRDGMVGDRRTSSAELAAFFGRLQERLGYMRPDNLERLRQACMALAGGRAHNVWPGWVTIRKIAFGLQTPPDPANPIMQSWLHSRRGPALRDHGGLVETYLFLRRAMRPPTEYEQKQIAAEARENARKRQRVVEAVAQGGGSEDDRQWLVWFDGLTDICTEIVEAGIAHRAAKGEAA